MKYLIILFCAIIGVHSKCNLDTKFSMCHSHLNCADKIITRNITINNYVNDVNGKDVILKRGVLGDLCENFIKHFNDKETIKIEDFGITRLVKGSFKNGFNELGLLIIDHNYISEIQDDVFTITNLTKLYMRHNGITVISDNAFKSLPNLNELDLSHNSIYYLVPHWFKLNFLNAIILDYNKIESIDTENFSNLILANKCGDEINCPVVSLEYNKINSVSPSAFKGLKNISHFNLKYNELDEIPPLISVHIGGLNIEYNEINYVSDIILDTYKTQADIIYLYGNKLSTISVYNIEESNKDTRNRVIHASALSL